MKMYSFPRFLTPLVTASALAAATAMSFAAESSNQSIRTTEPLEAVVPSEVRNLLLENPSVTFLVTVDESGTLVEHMPVAATHYKLISAAEKSLLSAKFTPAASNGLPVRATAQIAVGLYDPQQRNYFRGGGPLPFGNSASDTVDRRLYVTQKDRFAFRRSKPVQLDRPVEVTETKIMLYPDTSGRPASGECLVEYWVDASGNAKFPRIVKSDNDAVSTSALLTLKKTKFVPPTHDGLPTYVQVRQAMNFNTSPSVPDSAAPKG